MSGNFKESTGVCFLQVTQSKLLLCIGCCWLLTDAAQAAPAAFTLEMVDGLGRPVAGVQAEIFCGADKTMLHFESDADGRIAGSFDSVTCRTPVVSVKKTGFGSFMSGLRKRYVLSAQLTNEDVRRIVNLEGDELPGRMREMLAASGDYGGAVFFNEARLRPTLRTLAEDPYVAKSARDLLATIAEPEDLRLMARLPRPEKTDIFPDRWLYPVVTALIRPDEESEWSLLERCAANEFQDRWVDAGAIQTLKLTGGERSRGILSEAREKNSYRAALIDRAIEYIDSKPPALTGVDLDAVAKQVAQALKLGTWLENRAPRFNESGDKALVDLTFQSGVDYLVYTATFHRLEGTWTLRGVHETLQAFAPRATEAGK